MKTFLLLLMLTQAHAKCIINTPWQDIEKESAKEIEVLICEDVKIDCIVELSSIRGEWARVLVNRKIIYYLNVKDKKWFIIAKGPRFDIEMWERIGIPSGIR